MLQTDSNVHYVWSHNCVTSTSYKDRMLLIFLKKKVHITVLIQDMQRFFLFSKMYDSGLINQKNC